MLMSLSQLAHMSSRGREREKKRGELDWHLSVSVEADSNSRVLFRALIVSLALQAPEPRCQEINYSLWEISSLFCPFCTSNTLNHISCGEKKKHEKRVRNIGRYPLAEKVRDLVYFRCGMVRTKKNNKKSLPFAAAIVFLG